MPGPFSLIPDRWCLHALVMGEALLVGMMGAGALVEGSSTQILAPAQRAALLGLPCLALL